MRFLFDENLSPKLVLLLADQFPNSVHVRDVGLASADDELVWNYASSEGLIIVSKILTCINVALCSARRQRWYGSVWATVRRPM
jgi:predicted nuclease of predicted toxin-antitoxin system